MERDCLGRQTPTSFEGDRRERKNCVLQQNPAHLKQGFTMKFTRRKKMSAWLVATAAACLVLATAARPQSTLRPTDIAIESEHKLSTVATVNPNCTLIVPADPLSAAGLAAPYRLKATDPAAGACNEANAAQSAFVEAAIFDPATGTSSVYNPLVIDQGTAGAIAPVVPTLPPGAVVALWFGYDGSNLTLEAAYGSRLADGDCVNGARGSVFGQYAYCNAPVFFDAVNAAIRSGKLKVPPLGMASDGGRCPSTRDFFIVDQDQSDNLPTMYLATTDGRTAQNTAANRAALPNASLLGNPSDNRLLDIYVDPVMGCSAWSAADLADPGQKVPALALNEIQARMHQPTPVALIPLGDPMAEIDAGASLFKTNAYRRGVDQPVAIAPHDADTGRYCRQILRIAPQRMARNHAALAAAASPDPGAATSLLTFLAQRLITTYQVLDCETLIGHPDPVSVVRDATGVAVTASLDQAALRAILLAIEPSKLSDDEADDAARSR